MSSKNDKPVTDFFESWVLELPYYFGLPVPCNNNREKYQNCYVQFYLLLSIFILSCLILFAPSSLAQVLRHHLGFDPQGSLLRQTIGALTSNFVHGSFFHLFGNLYFFYIFAPLVEKKYGPINFLLIFCFCSFFSSFGTIFFLKDNHVSIGVSGTLMGFMGLIVAEDPNLKFRLYKYFVIPCWLLVFTMYFIPDLMAEYTARHSVSGKAGHINHIAHLLGFLSGYLLSFAMKPLSDKEKKTDINSLYSTDLDWLKTKEFWSEILLAIFIPFIVFMLNKSTNEKKLYGVINCFLYVSFYQRFAIIWAILFVVCDHKLRCETIRASKHL